MFQLKDSNLLVSTALKQVAIFE